MCHADSRLIGKRLAAEIGVLGGGKSKKPPRLTFGFRMCHAGEFSVYLTLCGKIRRPSNDWIVKCRV